MKKLFICLAALAVITSVTFTACGTDDSGKTTTMTTTTTTRTTTEMTTENGDLIDNSTTNLGDTVSSAVDELTSKMTTSTKQ